MEELKQLLLQTDDEYLIGISNKGTVKRAYKDLEAENPKIEWMEKEARTELKGAVCQLRIPLGESSCSCPSRSICRHLITAILYARQKAGEDGDSVQEPVEEGREKLKEEIMAFSQKKLERFSRTKGFRLFLAHLKAGELPQVQEGSVFTVSFPWENMAVKLLSPLEFSTCSCHSRELCVHKAQAILTIWLSEGKISLADLERQAESAESWDPDELKETAASIKEVIGLQLGIGLSRLSGEAQESMERLAIISRGARLPDVENEFRKAASEYQMYRERKAAFRVEELLERLLWLYHRACLLEKAKEPSEIKELAGSFRDTYEPVASLHLAAMGQRFFHSKTGYEGETYYFLELNQKRFYTWTDARPLFYETKRRRSAAAYTREEAPWGLNCTREELGQSEFYLKGARVTRDGRLSVSQETKGEIAGKRQLDDKGLEELVFKDYSRLLKSWDEHRGQPVLAGARKLGEAVFDPVEQRFSMELKDEAGRILLVAVKYSKEEQLTIRFLERLNKQLKEKKESGVIFLGEPYLEKGQLCLYPIEYFTEEELGIEEWAAEEKEADIGLGYAQESIEKVSSFLESIRKVLGDLFVCGLDSVQERLLKEIKSMGEEGEALGLHQLADRLYFLQERLDQRRHGVKPCMEELFTTWAYLSLCLMLCRKKASYDLALVTMEKDCEHREGREG
ncbi:MAG: SWIM zinc finger family protein [Lachnospiraceae bacterium]|nr:SWIM zinc finger family protein [Lachnospiraceae bacterium]